MNDSDKYVLILISLLKEAIILFLIFIILFIFFSLIPLDVVTTPPSNVVDNKSNPDKTPTIWERFVQSLNALNIILKSKGIGPYSFTAIFILYYVATFTLTYFNSIQPPRKSKRTRASSWYDYILNEAKHRMVLILFGPIVLFVFFSIVYGLFKTATFVDWSSLWKPLSAFKKIGILLFVLFYIYILIEAVYAWLGKKSIFPSSEPEFNVVRILLLLPTLITLTVVIFIFLFLTSPSKWSPFTFSIEMIIEMIMNIVMLILCMSYLTNIFYFFDINTFIAMLVFILVGIYIFYKNTT